MYTIDLCSNDLCIAVDCIELREKIMTLESESVANIHVPPYDL